MVFNPSKCAFYFWLYCMILVIVFGIHLVAGVKEMGTIWLIGAFFLQAMVWFYVYTRLNDAKKRIKESKTSQV